MVRQVLDTINKKGIHIRTMCLRINRKYIIGSEDPQMRAKEWKQWKLIFEQ